jgi:predicted acetyltransferase
VEIRTVTEEDLESYQRAQSVAFGQVFDAGRAEADRLIIDLDRSLAAFEDGVVVGTAGSSGFEMTVPGGSAAATAVQGVTVLPTHRRRGILTALMRSQIDEARARGDIVACLWATEAPIYGRFGYGPATVGVSWEADRRDVSFAPGVADTADALEVRLVPTEKARGSLEEVYERLRPVVPGAVQRPPPWWDRTLKDRDGGTLRAVVSDGSGAVGYASYRVDASWGYRGPDNRLSISELLAVSPAAHAALWRYVFGVDLVGTVSAYNRPPDDPLEWLITDRRALRRRINDAVWLRLVDVGAALRSREWTNPVKVVIGITDPWCPWNEGDWALEAGPDGAEVDRGAGNPDLVISAASLASVYLGGHRLAALAQAGLVRENRPGAVRALDLALAWDRAPWTVAMF